ncbi:MAG: endonuclease III [Chitinophagales bacterium]|nr:endonuclease III [Bacteroidota bacterium]MCB9042951.1 endonuclease III [Chitinophagales bacterium]
MKLVERIAFVSHTLDDLFPHPAVPLQHKDPYTLLVAVLLSAQCTDERVNKTTPELFALADTPDEMRHLAVPQIQRIIHPCGLAPAKAKHIHQLSEILVRQHQGEVPQNFADLEALPGVGHKTASVVMSQAFGVAAFPVDTHIHRLAWRWNLSKGKNVLQTERDLKRHFSESDWNKLHLQMIYFGRTYCPARGHKPQECPICSQIGRRILFKPGHADDKP